MYKQRWEGLAFNVLQGCLLSETVNPLDERNWNDFVVFVKEADVPEAVAQCQSSSPMIAHSSEEFASERAAVCSVLCLWRSSHFEQQYMLLMKQLASGAQIGYSKGRY
eukprot:3018003-Amphidinium_carterae.1